MSKPFDATLNILIDEHLAEWAGFLAARAGLPLGSVTAIDTDLSTTLQADRLFRIDGPTPVLLHLELESGGRLGIPDELLRYNIAAYGAHGLPVVSVVMLLRPKATGIDLTNVLELQAAGTTYLTFRYTVIRLWQESMDTLLDAGLGLAPLALLTNEAAADLPAALQRFDSRLREADAADNVKKKIASATCVLSGLRYSSERLVEYFMSIEQILEESSTYQWLIQRGEARGVAKGEAIGVAKGEAIGEARVVIRIATKRFGPPSPAVESTILAITDRDRLERIADRVLDANSWDELLAVE